MCQAQNANERQDGDGENKWRDFRQFESHAIGLNEKPEQLKAALVFLKMDCELLAATFVTSPVSAAVSPAISAIAATAVMPGGRGDVAMIPVV